LKRLLALLLFLLIWSGVNAQELIPQHRVISTEDGLSSNGTDLFLMDRQGIMWMSGGRGLDKFDGLRIINYSFEDDALKSNEVIGMAEDFEGKLWLLTSRVTANGQYDLQIFDPNLKSSQWLSDYLTNSSVPLPIRSLYNDRWHDELWVVHDQTVDVYGAKGYSSVYSTPHTIKQAYPAPKGLWVNHAGGFDLIDTQGKVLKSFTAPEEGTYEIIGVDSESHVYHFKMMDQEAMHRNRLYKDDSLFEVDGQYLWNDFPLLAINTQNDYTITREGYHYVMRDLNQDEISRVLPEIDFYTFPFEIYFDHYGNWWRYFNKQVHVFNYRKPQFQNYLTDFLIFGETGFNARGISPVNDSTLLVSGLGGTYLVNPKTGEKEELKIPYELRTGSLLFDYRRLDIARISPNELLMSTEGGLLFVYDLSDKSFRSIDSEQISYDAQGAITTEPIEMNWVVKAVDSVFYMGQATGLSVFKKGDKTYSKFSAYNEFPELANTSVFDIYEKAGVLWLGAETGLYQLTPGQGITGKVDFSGTTVGLNPSVRHINSFHDSTLHLATRSGIIEYNIERGELVNFWNPTNGMSDPMSYAVYQDHLERLWVPTNDGINLIDPASHEVRVFRESDGLANNEFNTTSHAQDERGVLYFGNLNGVTRLDPRDFSRNNQSDGLFLSSLRLQEASDGKFTELSFDKSSLNTVTMKPQHISLELKFGLRDYINPALNSFSYKIEGLDSEWTFNSSPEIRINRLPYGTYTLAIRAQGSYGVNYTEQHLTLVVSRPYYLTWWFLTLMLALLVTGTVVIIRYRERMLQARQKKLEEDIEVATEEIRQQAEELKSLDELKSNFFANTSHELRTPLSLILAPLEEVIARDNLSVGDKNTLELAKRNTETIKSLVDEILDLSRLENGVAQPRYARVFVNAYFKNLIDNFKPKADSQAIALRFSSELGENDHWHLDTSMADKIINNLMSNALKFTASGGLVEVRISAKEGLYIEVADNGEGISTQDLPYVFDRFFQTKDPDRKTEGGTGIGLALSYELAAAMNGELSVVSEWRMGSTFSLWLPEVNGLEFASPLPSEQDIPEDHPTLYFADKRILLVEDNTDLSTFISINLKELFRIETCSNGIEALDYLRNEKNEPTDLIISDMMMPKLDGLGMLQAIRSDERLSSIPVVFLTARSAERDKLEAFRLGVDDYLLKPFSLEELKARIKNQLKVAHLKSLQHQGSESNGQGGKEISLQEKWLVQVRRQTEENIGSIEFNVALLAEKTGESERTFYRKLKEATGYSPNAYIKEIRLQMARSYLERGEFRDLGSVSTAIGFSSKAYFSRQYKERFGKFPSDYFKYA